MDDPTRTPLPSPEVTRRSLGELLVTIGFAADLQEGEHLASLCFPDLPGEISLEDA